jgi:hypothetical protein
MNNMNRTSQMLLAVVMILAVSERAHAEIPLQLDDRSFWRLVTEMSEAGRVFPSENMVSNEPNFQLVLRRLKERVERGHVYLGVGPEQNFTYIAAVQPSMAFIIDIRRQNQLQHLMYKAIFEMSPDRLTFLSVLFSRSRPDRLDEKSTLREILDAYKNAPLDAGLAASNRNRIKDLLVTAHGFPLTTEDLETLDHVHRIFELYGPETAYGSTLETVDATRGPANGNFIRILTSTDDQGANESFLAREELFRLVRDMQMRNLIVPIVGDFGGEKALNAVAQYLHENKATVGVFYLSNVEQYLFQRNPRTPNGGAQRFYENVAALPLNPSSTFIRVSNNTAFKQIYPGFTTHLGLIGATLDAFREKRFLTLRDVFALPRD